MSFSTSHRHRAAFPAEVHVGVLTVAAAAGRRPLATPVWYSYQPGGQVSLTTSGSSGKARAIAAAGRFMLCARDEAAPYKYLTVEGSGGPGQRITWRGWQIAVGQHRVGEQQRAGQGEHGEQDPQRRPDGNGGGERAREQRAYRCGPDG